jgi:hypothetical protein
MPATLSSNSRIRGLTAPIARVATVLVFLSGNVAADTGGAAATAKPREIPSDALPVISATLGQADARYRIEPSASGLHAANPAQRVAAIFTARGVTLRTGHERLTIRFSGYGRARSLAGASSVRPVAEANRAEYRRGILTEWYSNGPYGFEQGFTLATRPDGPTGTPLRIALNVSGMTAAASDADAVTFFGRDSKPLFRCAELTARDSAGRPLPARMELHGQRLTLLVTDAGARYPIVVDPTYAQSTPILSAGGPRADLGTSLAIDGQNQTIVAAAPGDLNSVHGFAWVFVRQPGGQWFAATELRNTDNEVAGVAISGDGTTIVVGSCSIAPCIGHAFVYAIPGALVGWANASPMDPAATLSAPNGQTGDRIGQSVATDLYGDTVAFGAPCDTTAGAVLCGTVYVFVRPVSGTWATSNQPTAQLTFNLPSGSAVDSLGFSVAMDGPGDTIVAGAPGVQSLHQGSGAAYVFVRPTTAVDSWVDTRTAAAVLKSYPGGPSDGFGSSVAIDFGGDTIAVGAPLLPSGCSQPCGGAFVFLRPGSAGGWRDAPDPKNQDATLMAAVSSAGNALGRSVSITANGSTVVAAGNNGAYVFNMPPAGWANTAPNEGQVLAAAAGVDVSGSSVATTAGFASVFVSSDASVVGGGNPAATVGGNASQGAVLLFTASVCAALTPTRYDYGTVPQYKPVTIPFTLTNACDSPLNEISPSVVGPNAGHFSQAGNCGATLAAHSSCNFTVTFLPMSFHTESATLNVADVDGSSPQQAFLTGVSGASDADFTLAPTSADPPSSGSSCPPSGTAACSATVMAGQTATYQFLFKSVNDFGAAVTATVSSPDLPTDSMRLSDATVQPTPGGTVVTLSIATRGSSAAATSDRVPAVSRMGAFAAFPAWLSLLAIGWREGSRIRPERPRRLSILLLLALVMGGGGLMLGCSNNSEGSNTNASTPWVVPAGTYQVTVNASFPGDVQQGAPANRLAIVTLKVQ